MRKNPHATRARAAVSSVVRHKKFILLAVFALVINIGFLMSIQHTLLPTRFASIAPEYKIAAPISLPINHKLSSLDTSKIAIAPLAHGTWKVLKQPFFSGDVLVFTPTKPLKANTRYTIRFPTAHRAIGGSTKIPTLAIKTEKAPNPLHSGLLALKPESVIAADQLFSVSFPSSIKGLRDVQMRTTPAIELKKSPRSSDTRLIWEPVGQLPADTKFAVDIYDQQNRVSLFKSSFVVAGEPRVSSPADRYHLGERDSVGIEFSQPVKPEEASKITFDIKGKALWKSERLYEFIPDKVAPGKTYHYTIQKGLRSTAGGISTIEQTGTFSTIGSVTVVGSSPRGARLGQNGQTIKFTFDQPVDHASAEARFSVSRGQRGTPSWSGNTLSVPVNNLGFQQTVTATIAPGVKNAGFGLPSAQSFSVSFTTEVRTMRLSVPSFRQQFSASCTAAALRMALAYRGVGSDDMGLVQAMGYSPRGMDRSTDPPSWDDPNEMFVGDINGRDIYTAAGPDAAPVAKAARAYGRSASSVNGIGATWIAQQVYNGNPVIMFGAKRNAGNISWRTPSGRITYMNPSAHATTVLGVEGEPDNPLGFFVNDPASPGTKYWSTAQVNANIARDPYRQAVVVY